MCTIYLTLCQDDSTFPTWRCDVTTVTQEAPAHAGTESTLGTPARAITDQSPSSVFEPVKVSAEGGSYLGPSQESTWQVGVRSRSKSCCGCLRYSSRGSSSGRVRQVRRRQWLVAGVPDLAFPRLVS